MTPTPIVPAMKPSASPERDRDALAKIIADNTGAMHGNVIGSAAAAGAILRAGYRPPLPQDEWDDSLDHAHAEIVELRRQIDDLRESWIAARHVVFAAREVCSAWPADLDFGKPGTSIGKLRDVVTAYDQRNHEDTIGTPSSGIGWRRITEPPAPDDNDKAREGKL